VHGLVMIEALFNLSAFDRRGNEIGAPRNLADVKFWGNLTAGIAKIPDICPAFCARQNLPFIQRLSAAGSYMLGGADRRVSDRKRAKLPTLQSIFLHQPPQHRDQGKARDPAEQDFKPHRPAQDNTEQQIRSRRVFDDGCPIAILLQIDQRKY
jgi:hypothetical protein